MSHSIDPHEIELRHALRSGADALQQMREAHERAARELAHYETQYTKVSNPVEKARILNRAILHVSASVLPNARIDLAADAQAELNAIAKRSDAA